LAFGVEDNLVIRSGEDAFEQLQVFLTKNRDWVFGYMAYDLKNSIEDLTSENEDHLHFPDMIFFKPKVVLSIKKDDYDFLKKSDDYSEKLIAEIVNETLNSTIQKRKKLTNKVKSRTTKEAYFSNAKKILKHIHRGDIYELNYCQEFFADDVTLDPWQCYLRLNDITKAPYSTYMRWNEFHIMSGSPELFLERKENEITSKPIKGTTRRGENKEEDEALKEALKNDQKELSENIMIVDIVRNDLSRTAKKNSVKVTELCEIYSYETVHQMISTVKSEVEEKESNADILKHAFPMGSMTGAPKIRAMELIEEFEDFKRGIYSGAVGFFKPSGDFTFNVIIRTVLYNAEKKYCSMAAGGAFTALSQPEKEYEESLLKANSMFNAVVGYEE